MFNVPLLVWLSLAFLIVVSTVCAVSLFRAGFGLWRTLRRFGERVDGTFNGITEAADRLQAASEAAGADLPRLEAAKERLRVSLARVAVLRAAVRDVQEAVAGVTAFYPRK